jgi:AraC-like DNA-binding protein
MKTMISAVTYIATIKGMQAHNIPLKQLQIPMDRFRKLDGDLVDVHEWENAWKFAEKFINDQPEFPTLVANAIPEGEFGLLEHMAASAPSVRSILKLLPTKFNLGILGTKVEVVFPKNNEHSIRVRIFSPQEIEPKIKMIHDEFIIANFIKFGLRINPGKAPLRVYLRQKKGRSNHEKIWNCSVVYNSKCPGIDLDPIDVDHQLKTRNLTLHDLLLSIYDKLYSIYSSKDFELSIRHSVREALKTNDVTAKLISKRMGISERTLFRFLATTSGRSFQDIVDEIRIEESEWMLNSKKYKLVEIASKVAFADQSSWSRFFKKHKGISPGKFLKNKI